MSDPVFHAIAEHALLVEFGDLIASDIHDRVLALDAALTENPFHGFAEAVPAYTGILIEFDPAMTDHVQVTDAVRGLITGAKAVTGPARLHDVPVCYEGDLAPDLAGVSAATGMAPEAVVNAHIAGDYKVWMYGFAPGYAYMAGVPEPIRLPRKPSAIRDIPAGSVIVAGAQCIVTTLTMPTGWWIIGRSPARILTGDPDRPFLFDVGDRVRFRRVSRAVFDGAGE